MRGGGCVLACEVLGSGDEQWASGQLSLYHHVSAWNSKESTNSLYESGFPGNYKGIFVMIGG